MRDAVEPIALRGTLEAADPGITPSVSEQQTVQLVIDGRGGPPDEALERLREALGDATFGTADETGAFEVSVSAGSFEAGVKRVFDAIAAAGADDHLIVMEHPDIPGHWRRADGRTGGAH